MAQCKYCKGNGKSYSTTLQCYVTCDGCAGTGQTGWPKCSECNGTGKNYNGRQYVTCGKCGGSGRR